MERGKLHDGLLKRLEDTLKVRDIDAIKVSMRYVLGYGPARLDKMASFAHIWSEMERDNHLDINKYETLKEMLRRIKHMQSVGIIEETEKQFLELNRNGTDTVLVASDSKETPGGMHRSQSVTQLRSLFDNVDKPASQASQGRQRQSWNNHGARSSQPGRSVQRSQSVKQLRNIFDRKCTIQTCYQDNQATPGVSIKRHRTVSASEGSMNTRAASAHVRQNYRREKQEHRNVKRMGEHEEETSTDNVSTSSSVEYKRVDYDDIRDMLTEAVRSGDDRAVRGVLDEVAPCDTGHIINTSTDKVTRDRPPVLIKAAREGYLDIAKYLILHGADVEMRDVQGRSPLLCASCNGHQDLVVYLVEQAGANINSTSNQGWTHLMLATINGHTGIIRILLDHGGHQLVNYLNVHGRTALHHAAYRGHLDIVNFLIKAGASCNVKDEDGRTALHFAALWGHLAIVPPLLQAGASPNVTSKQGQTPLHSAAYWGYLAIVQLLLQSGALCNVKDLRGSTPIMCAQRQHRTSVANYLHQWERNHIYHLL